jgi:hypothetical protein
MYFVAVDLLCLAMESEKDWREPPALSKLHSTITLSRRY